MMPSSPSTSSQTKLHPSRIDMPETTRIEVNRILNIGLASTFDLYSHLKQAHWNVKGPDFIQLHELFDEIATEVNCYVDMVAERITALAGTAIGTTKEAAANSILKEYPTDIFAGSAHLTALADRLAAYGKWVRAQIDETANLGDANTADLFTEISRGIDQRLWFIEAHLQSHG